MKIFFEWFFCVSCHLFLIPSASSRSIPFLSFIVPVFAWNVPLVSLIFLEISHLSHCDFFLYFYALITEEDIFYLSLLFFGSLHSDGYIFPFFLWLSLLFPQLFVRPPPDNQFTFLHFFFLGMVLITASCTMSQTSILSSLGTLSNIIPWIYHFHCIIVRNFI